VANGTDPSLSFSAPFFNHNLSLQMFCKWSQKYQLLFSSSGFLAGTLEISDLLVKTK
jgi:hypothetical protein